MKSVVIVLLLFFAALPPNTSSEPSRFKRIFDASDYIFNSSAKRNASLDINFSRRHSPIAIDSTLDSTSYNSVNYDAVFSLAKTRSSTDTFIETRSQSSFTSLLIQRQINEYLYLGHINNPGEGQAYDQLDTEKIISSVPSLFLGSWQYQKQWREYPGIPSSGKQPGFFTWGIENNIQSRYIHSENIDPFIPDSLLFSKFTQNTLQGGIHSSVSAGIGFGRPKTINYLLDAFAIERRLKQNNVIAFPLDDKTMEKISILIAQFDSYQIKKPEIFKTFKKELDSILIKDVSTNKKNLKRLSEFDLKRIILRNMPRYEQGIRGTILISEDISNQWEIIKYEQRDWFDTTDLDSSTNLFAHSAKLHMNLNAGWVFNQYLFCHIDFDKPLFIEKNFPDNPFYYVKDPGMFLISGEVTFWPFSPLILTAGFKNISFKQFSPHTDPEKLFVRTESLIEDYVSINFTLSLLAKQTLPLADLPQHDSQSRVGNGIGLNLSIRYAF
jgi:hypothetical protein